MDISSRGLAPQSFVNFVFDLVDGADLRFVDQPRAWVLDGYDADEDAMVCEPRASDPITFQQLLKGLLDNMESNSRPTGWVTVPGVARDGTWRLAL